MPGIVSILLVSMFMTQKMQLLIQNKTTSNRDTHKLNSGGLTLAIMFVKEARA